jgi:hypothetical protein
VRAVLLGTLAFLLVACGATKPSVSASTDKEGVLTVRGTEWTGCGDVRVKLPAPWGSTTQTPSGKNFSLVYAHPGVKPYAGIVVVTQPGCGGRGGLEAATKIKVGDARAKGGN